MVYIESHQQLGVHPKTKKAARLLGLSRPAVIGHLQYFWWWAMDFAKDGDVTNYSADVIADGAMWEGDPDAFIAALVDCAITLDGHGFLERKGDRLLIHDWDQHGGKIIARNAADLERWGAKYKALRLRVISRDGLVCGICHQAVPADGVDIDHILPRSKGGPTTEENLRVTHIYCNRSRGNRMDERTEG